MMLKELVDKLREIRTDRDWHDEGLNYPSDGEFEQIVLHMDDLYLNDETFYSLVNNNDLDGLIDYLSEMKQNMENKYSHVFRNGHYGDLLGDHIEKRNFNAIFSAFKEKRDYHARISFEKHLEDNGFKPSQQNDYSAHFYVEEYKNWENLINDFYKDVMEGDFRSLTQAYIRMNILSGMIYSIKLYCKETKTK